MLRPRAIFALFLVLAPLVAGLASCSSADNASGGDASTPSDATLEPEVSTANDDASAASDATSAVDSTLPPDSGPGDDSSARPDDGAPGDTSAPTDAADASLTVSAIVGPAGLTLIHPLGAMLTIPPGAIATPTLITLAPAAPPTNATIGLAFTITPSGLAFATPASVTLAFDPSEAPDGAAASSFAIAQSTDNGAMFTALSSTENATADTITATTAQTGEFAPIYLSGGGLFVTSPSPLPLGTVGTAYSTALVATGGTSPYTWSLAAGAPNPPGLTLAASGALAGTPTTVGHYSFFVLVADSAAHETEAALTMNVAPANNPVPTLTSLSPTHAPANNNVNVTVTGTGFTPSAEITIGAAAVQSAWVSPTEMIAELAYNNIASAGSYSLTVTNPTLGGGASNALTFTADTPSYPVPTLTSLSPTHGPQNNGITLTLTGTGFVQWTTVQAGTTTVPATVESTTQIVAQLQGPSIPAAGPYSITVTNPSPGGGASNALTFTADVYNGVPSILTLSPPSMPAGSPDTQVTIGGANFVSGSAVFANGTPASSSFVSSTQLLALIPAADLLDAGSVTVTVENPPPGGGTSVAVTFFVGGNLDGTPIVTGVSPGSIEAGAPGVTITLTGSGFVPPTYVGGSPGPGTCQIAGYVLFDGIAVGTTNVSWTQVTGTVHQALLQSPHLATVTYSNPLADGGAAAGNTVPFEVTALNDAGCPAACASGQFCQNATCCDAPGQETSGTCCSGAVYVIAPPDLEGCEATCQAVGTLLPNQAFQGANAPLVCCTSRTCFGSQGTVCN